MKMLAYQLSASSAAANRHRQRISGICQYQRHQRWRKPSISWRKWRENGMAASAAK